MSIVMFFDVGCIAQRDTKRDRQRNLTCLSRFENLTLSIGFRWTKKTDCSSPTSCQLLIAIICFI